MTIPLQQGLVYGPVESRRLGRSLGVNILPHGSKRCNFNCPYCQYGWTPGESLAGGDEPEWPTPAEVADAVERALRQDPAVDRVTLAGNGEPTLHPQFPAIVSMLRGVISRCNPRARLAVLSNASTLDRPDVRAALGQLDERFMKLDAGDDETLRRLNGVRMPVERVVRGLQDLGGVVLQSMFTRDGRSIDNTTPEALGKWMAAVKRIGPSAVHIYSLDRPPAWGQLQRVPRAELESIAEGVRKAGIEALVF